MDHGVFIWLVEKVAIGLRLFICNATFIIRKELCSREKEKAARNKSYGLYLFEEVIT